MRVRWLAVLFLLAAPSVPATSAGDEFLAIEGGTVFDGTGKVYPEAVVLIRGEKIERIVPSDRARVPEDARTIDARGKLVVPGFVDLHFHYDPRDSPWLPLIFLANGVTTQREMGNWIEENHEWLEETRGRGLPVPRMLFSGPLLDGTGPAYPNGSLTLLDVPDARRVTNELIDKGATSLKAYFRLPLSLMEAVIEEADRRNVPVHGHLEIVDARDAFRVGLDGIEHTTSLGRSLIPPRESEAYRQAVLAENSARGPGRYRVWAGIDPNGEAADELIALMLEHEINLDATIAVFEPANGEVGHDQEWEAIRNLGTFTARYHEAGGSVTMGSHGTVANAAPGFAFQREMEAHVEAGMSPADVLQCATRTGARALRLDDRGVLARGKLADVVILDGDPLENISDASRVHAVILGGQVLDRERLLAARPTPTGE